MNKIRFAYSLSIALHIIGIIAVITLLNPLNSNNNNYLEPATITYIIQKPNIKEILPNLKTETQNVPPLKINTNNKENNSNANKNPITNVNTSFTATNTLKRISSVETNTITYPQTVGNILPNTLILDDNKIQINFQNNPRLLLNFDKVQDAVSRHTKNGILSYFQRLARLLIGKNDNNPNNNNTNNTLAITLNAHILIDKSGRVYSVNFISRGLPVQETIMSDIIQSLRFNAETDNSTTPATITINIPL